MPAIWPPTDVSARNGTERQEKLCYTMLCYAMLWPAEGQQSLMQSLMPTSTHGGTTRYVTPRYSSVLFDALCSMLLNSQPVTCHRGHYRQQQARSRARAPLCYC